MSSCICGPIGVVHVYRCVCKRTHVYIATCGREHVCERVCKRVCVRSLKCSRKRSRPHISAAQTAQPIISDNYSPWQVVNGGGKGRAVLSERCLERQVAVESWCVRAVIVKQQLQKPTSERMLLADLQVELWSLFVTSAGLRVVNTMQAFYFTVSRPRHLCLLIIWGAAWLRVTTCRPIQFTYKFSATVIQNIRPNECINESPRAFKVHWRWC